jgi:hypothetical protein
MYVLLSIPLINLNGIEKSSHDTVPLCHLTMFPPKYGNYVRILKVIVRNPPVLRKFFMFPVSKKSHFRGRCLIITSYLSVYM